jgi:hypothetical protein
MKFQGVFTCLVLATMSACSSQDDIDIGDENAAKTGATLSDYASSWVGYVEAAHFADDSDRIQLDLDQDGQGTLVVGDSGDPTLDPTEPPLRVDELVPGFRYSVQGTELEAARLQLGVQRTDAFAPWCALQTPVRYDPSDDDRYGCYPNYGSERVDDEGRCFIEPVGQAEQEVDCDVFVCDIAYACECTANHCAANQLPISEPRLAEAFSFLDVALEAAGERMVGTLIINGSSSGGERLTVRLERQ